MKAKNIVKNWQETKQRERAVCEWCTQNDIELSDVAAMHGCHYVHVTTPIAETTKSWRPMYDA